MDHGFTFTVGVEEEFQIVDPDTWELRSHVSELLASGAPSLGDQLKRELHQSIVEVGTKICANIDELDDEICYIRRELSESAERVGLRIAAAGTHPFSRWKDQVISPGERYENIVEELQQLARSLLIFGLHIHVAVPDRSEHDRAAQRGALFPAAPARALDQLAVLAGTRHGPEVLSNDGLPTVSALAASPTSSTRGASTRNTWRRSSQLHCIDNAKKVWWDLRPHPTFGTLEFRICDVPTSPRVTIALAALAQAIVVKLYRLRRKNLGLPDLLARAGRREQVARGALRARRTADRLRPPHRSTRCASSPSNCSSSSTTWWTSSAADTAVEYVQTIVAEGTSADRQLQVYRRDGRSRERRPLARGRDPRRQQEGACEGWTVVRP